MQKRLEPGRSVLPALRALFILGALMAVFSTACRQGVPVETPGSTAAPAFPPGSLATRLARPAQEQPAVVGETAITGTAQVGLQPAEPADSTPRAGPALSTAHDQYDIAASLLLDQHQLVVRQEITYTNRTGTPLETIWLVIEPDRQEGVFNLETISWESTSLKPVRSGEGIWQIKLPSELSPGQAGILDVSYRLDLQAGGGVLGYSRRQLNFGDWYVRIPPYQPEVGWLVHDPGAAGEHNVYGLADFKVELDLGDAGRGLVVAASAPGQACREKLCYEMLASRGFAWSASEEYQVFEAVEEGINLQQYVFPEHAVAGQAALEVARQAVRIFQAEFGAYPYPGLAMVEAGFFDGMEYPGMFFLGEEYFTNYDGSPKGYLTALTAHEIAHQWWFALVGSDQALEPWLDEALSTYSELIYYQGQYPDLADWWWEFRVRRFQPGGFVDSTIYDQAGFRPYVNAVYLRGAQFLQELRLAMGEEAFKAFLHSYFEAYQGKIATAEGFFSLAEQYVGREKLQVIRQLYFSR